ncbi:hypothetical protein ALQ08_103946 [Pseudomonas syringae pv. delphinii]|uniref:Uncharacterized protein n=1 Tax=Pseudomonas syringae pv. delphinii TaxID=192088 RepID=A0A0N8REK8_9PSED|nr:hypothetical protein ALO72_103226 [Pseudomonas syringae pv. delphinii]RMP16953.1 hypothetical protein ALQ28_103740 [Pseudomonas syringae pv. delphinii]RMP18162.1 hypothetical protein ALQ27_104018 [Pseudomonas syringae pv. delphinii]RMQ29658.1 hypothetical protein ALQ08_103946 [Pseudomonas syringae pv. delphinii]
MGLTVGRGRINKNELAGKYLERFLEAGALHCTAHSREDAERPELHAYAERRHDNLQAVTYPNAPAPWPPRLCVCR